MTTQHTPEPGVAAARDRLRERVQNEATCLALLRMLRDVEQQRDELRAALELSHEHMKLHMQGFYEQGQNVFEANAKAIAKAGGA